MGCDFCRAGNFSRCARCLYLCKAEIFLVGWDQEKSEARLATSILDLSPDRSAEGAADMEDLRLVEGLREGANWAYEDLIARFQQPVYALALRLLSGQSEACDVVQEVFLKVFRNISGFRGQSSLKTWIYRITVNEAHNARRWFFRHRRREVDLDNHPDDIAQLEGANRGRRPLAIRIGGGSRTADHRRSCVGAH